VTAQGRQQAMAAKAPVDIHWGRLGLLALVLVAAALYVSPLRSYFAQQTRYAQQSAALQNAKQQNVALKSELVKLQSVQYVSRLAREQFLVVPPGMQAFVIKGLPQGDTPVTDSQPPPVSGSMSVLQRLADLWRTLLH
jgi:cell division protein FtsB